MATKRPANNWKDPDRNEPPEKVDILIYYDKYDGTGPKVSVARYLPAYDSLSDLAINQFGLQPAFSEFIPEPQVKLWHEITPPHKPFNPKNESAVIEALKTLVFTSAVDMNWLQKVMIDSGHYTEADFELCNNFMIIAYFLQFEIPDWMEPGE